MNEAAKWLSFGVSALALSACSEGMSGGRAAQKSTGNSGLIEIISRQGCDEARERLTADYERALMEIDAGILPIEWFPERIETINIELNLACEGVPHDSIPPRKAGME